MSVAPCRSADPLAQGTATDYALTNSSIWLRDSGGGDTAVTGLRVYAGRTLTLGLNDNWGGEAGQDTCYVTFPEDVRLKTHRRSGGRPNLGFPHRRLSAKLLPSGSG